MVEEKLRQMQEEKIAELKEQLEWAEEDLLKEYGKVSRWRLTTLIFACIVIMQVIWCKRTSTEAKDYLQIGRESVAIQWIVEDNHNKKKITDELYHQYYEVLEEYLKEPKNKEKEIEYIKILKEIEMAINGPLREL